MCIVKVQEVGGATSPLFFHKDSKFKKKESTTGEYAASLFKLETKICSLKKAAIQHESWLWSLAKFAEESLLG